VGFEKLRHVKFWCLEDLGLSDVNVVEGVDTLKSLLAETQRAHNAEGTHLGSLFNLTTNALGDELRDKLLQVTTLSLTTHNFNHLGANLSDLGRLGVCRLFDLVECTSSKANSEQSEEVAVGGSDVDRSLDKTLPFADDGAEFVSSEVHAEERGEAVLALSVVSSKFGVTRSRSS
jgi:hypothetical protein